jgi:hypothetical protein
MTNKQENTVFSIIQQDGFCYLLHAMSVLGFSFVGSPILQLSRHNSNFELLLCGLYSLNNFLNLSISFCQLSGIVLMVVFFYFGQCMIETSISINQLFVSEHP